MRLPVRRASSGALAFVLAFAGWCGGAAADQPATLSALDRCPGTVRNFLGVDPGTTTAGHGPASTFGFTVETRQKEPRLVYTLVLANDESVYTVKLPLTIDRNPTKGDGFSSEPVYVRFAHPTLIHDAWIGSVSLGDASVVCGPNNIASDRLAFRGVQTFPVAAVPALAAVVEGAATATAIVVDEAAAKPAPAPACPFPEVSARTLYAVPPRQPAFGDVQGVAQVLLALDAESRVVSARILTSGIGPTASAEALRVTRASFFRTEIYRCNPVPSEYVFIVDYR